MNPIENLWHELKENTRSSKARTKEQLVDAIKEFWLKVTPAKCQRYINHLRKVYPAVIESNGQATGY